MHKRNALATFDVPQMVIDCALVVLAYATADLVYGLIRGTMLFVSHSWMLLLFAVIFFLTMFVNRMYNITTFYYFDRVIIRTLSSAGVAAVVVGMAAFLLQRSDTSRLLYFTFCFLAFAYVCLYRLIFRVRGKSNSRTGANIIFVGRKPNYQKFTHYIEQTSMQYNFVSNLAFDEEELATPEAFEKYLIAHNIDEVAFDYSHDIIFEYRTYMLVCEEMGITVRLVLDMFDMPVSKTFINSIGTFPVITYHSVSMNKGQLFIKGVMDVLCAFFGLIFLSPVFLITAIAIKLESPGPVFFAQKRAGLNGKVFKIYKFRSMYMDAEERKKDLMCQNKIEGGLMFKIDDDPRITKVGKFIRKTSIDELPQLWNVLKRDMSLVGTRPPTLDEVRNYKRDHRRRISIRPGITGLWQVSGRSDILDFEEVVNLDKTYIDQWTIGLDISLLFKTVAVVFSRRGSY